MRLRQQVNGRGTSARKMLGRHLGLSTVIAQEVMTKATVRTLPNRGPHVSNWDYKGIVPKLLPAHLEDPIGTPRTPSGMMFLPVFVHRANVQLNFERFTLKGSRLG